MKKRLRAEDVVNDSELVNYYRLRAPEYEQIYYRDRPLRRRELNDEAVRLRKLVAGRSVLDLACGTGYWLQQMSETASAVVATDISIEMIGEARKKSYACAVDFAVADILALPFANRSFDVVTLGFWFSHHPRQALDGLLDAIACPLNESGRIWMIDNNPPAEELTRQPVGEDEYGNRYAKRYLEDGRAFVIMKNYFQKEELESLFSRRFRIDSLTYGRNYWSVVLTPGRSVPLAGD